MSNIVERFEKIKSNIKKLDNKDFIKIVAISKTFDLDYILPLINHGHIHFGENKVQEAEAKWKGVRKNNSSLQLHMVGKLQSNKAKKAVEVFDYIHSLDSHKLADILSKSQDAANKSLKYFIQVNIGNEKQKSGIPYNEVDSFYTYCVKEKIEHFGINGHPP